MTCFLFLFMNMKDGWAATYSLIYFKVIRDIEMLKLLTYSLFNSRHNTHFDWLICMYVSYHARVYLKPCRLAKIASRKYKDIDKTAFRNKIASSFPTVISYGKQTTTKLVDHYNVVLAKTDWEAGTTRDMSHRRPSTGSVVQWESHEKPNTLEDSVNGSGVTHHFKCIVKC